MIHELPATQPASLHQLELVLPVSGEFRRGDLGGAEMREREQQRGCLWSGHQFPAVAVDIVLVDQPLNDRRARGGGAQPLRFHRGAKLVVLHQLAGALHGREQGGFRVARRRLGLIGHGVEFDRFDLLIGLDRGQVCAFLLCGPPVDRKPARARENSPIGPELMVLNARNSRGLKIFGRREENGEKAAHDQVVDLLFRLVEVLGQLQGRNDRKVIAYFAVVEDAPVRANPVVFQYGRGMRGVLLGVLEELDRLFDRTEVVLRKSARIGARIGENLVALIERLSKSQRRPCGEAEAAVCLALKARKIEEKRRELGRGLGLFRDATPLSPARRADRLGLGGRPEPLGPTFSIVVLLELGIEPPSRVLPGPGREARVDFPVIARVERANSLFALHQDCERRGLNAPDRGLVETALAQAIVERRHRARAVDAHEPVSLRTRARSIGQRQQLLVGAQPREAFADGRRRHRLQPEALNGLRGLGVLDDVAEDELAFAPGVAGIDYSRDVLALDETKQKVQA